jgi:hypothetical protein
VHADNWAQQLASRMINVIHRHITFTLPSELWSLLEENTEWRKELFGAANETLRQVIKATPGIVMVLHPYLDFRQREKGQEESQHLRHYNKLDFDKNQADRSRFLPRLTTE